MTAEAGDVANTPHGRNVRYSFHFHVVGRDRDEIGSVPAVDDYVTLRVITPLGALKAAAVAALMFKEREPRSKYSEVELVHEERSFVPEDGDYRDDESRAR